jgi:hypothetical protein
VGEGGRGHRGKRQVGVSASDFLQIRTAAVCCNSVFIDSYVCLSTLC